MRKRNLIVIILISVIIVFNASVVKAEVGGIETLKNYDMTDWEYSEILITHLTKNSSITSDNKNYLVRATISASGAIVINYNQDKVRGKTIVRKLENFWAEYGSRYPRDKKEADIEISKMLKMMELIDAGDTEKAWRISDLGYGVNDGDTQSETGRTADDMLSSAESFVREGAKNEGKTIDMEKLTPVFVEFGQMLSGIGAIVLLIVTGIMGTKFMLANPEQKAGLQKQLVGLIVATFVIFGSYIIWSVVVNILTASTTGV